MGVMVNLRVDGVNRRSMMVVHLRDARVQELHATKSGDADKMLTGYDVDVVDHVVDARCFCCILNRIHYSLSSSEYIYHFHLRK